MNLARALRLSLVPLGVMVATRGLNYLAEEADELTAAIEARRAQLGAGDGDQDHAAAATHPAAPQDFLSTPPSSHLEAGKSSVRAPRWGRRLALGVAGAAVAFAGGVYVAVKATRALPPTSPAHLLEAFAPCGICTEPVKLLDAFPGHICPDCWELETGADAHARAVFAGRVDPEPFMVDVPWNRIRSMALDDDDQAAAAPAPSDDEDAGDGLPEAEPVDLSTYPGPVE